HRATAGFPLVLLHAVAEHVVGVGHRQRSGGPVRGLPHGGQTVVVVVAVVPRLQPGTPRLLGQVALTVVSVRPRTVVGQPISRAGLVAGHSAIAVGVVAVVVAAVAGELVGQVIGIGGLGRAVELLGQHAVSGIVGVSVVGQHGIAAVFMLQVTQPRRIIEG